MQVGNILARYAIFNPSLKRRDIEQMFTDRLNAERGKEYKPLSASFVAWRMKEARLSSKNDLVAFYQMCDSKPNFSGFWWWSLTPHEGQTERR